MIFGKKLLLINFILFGVLFALSASANGCPTASPLGVGCSSGQYYCGGSCRVMATSCPTWTPSSICAAGLNCDNCATADACGVCSSCVNTTTHTLCGTYPNRVCQANTTPPAHCKTYNQCTSVCSACNDGYYLSGNQCIQAVLKLGPDSVSGATAVVQSTNNTLMYLGGSGVSIGTSTIPTATALNVVGATMFSENLSMINNKSIKVDNTDSNTTLLIGNYGDGQGFGYGASTTRTASLAVEGDVKANRLCIKEDCRAEWSDIQGTSYWTASSTYIYNNNSGNVGIGDNEPYNKLSVNGNIVGSGSLAITGTATSSNYFISNLGVGGLPNGFWNKFVDLSGSGNSAYIVKTGSINAVVAVSDSGTPAGTGYNFTHSGQQMVLGTVTNQPLNFITNGTSKMFLSADGKLGIGTTSPAEMLDVNGGTRIGTINNATGDIVTVSSSGVIQKRTAEQLRSDIGAAKEINSLYYVEGNTTGTAGTWTGNIDGLDAYYDGLTIAYKIGIAGASGLTLNINNLGAKAVRRNTVALTTHLPVGTVVVLTYTTISSTGYWVWADYDSDSGYYYLRWNGANVIAGETTTRYKIIMEGHDGLFYPLTIGDNTNTNGKTVSSARFKMNGQILWYLATATVSSGAPHVSTNLYSDYHSTVANYTFNKVSGWVAGMAVYLVGSVDNDGYFVLDNSSPSAFMSQNLPNNDDGRVYILLGYMADTTSGFKLTPDRIAYHYKDGKIRLYETMSGTGSSNYITKWTGSTALGSSNIYNDGSSVGINTTTPEAALEINGNAIASPPTNSKHLATKGYVDSAVATTSNSLWTLSGSNLYASSTNWNVGIGTTSPSYKLTVAGNIYNTGWITSDGDIVSNNSSSGHYVTLSSGNSSEVGLYGDGGLIAGYWPDQGFLGNYVYGGSLIFADPFYGTVGINNYPTSTVGLSVLGPGTAAIDVAGGRITNLATPAFGSDAATKSYVDSAVATTSHSLWTLSGNNLYASSTSWNVGIGTTSPTAQLHLYPNADKEGLRIVTSNYSPLVIRNATDGADLLRVSQTGTTTIGGYLGVGTTIPGTNLEVVSDGTNNLGGKIRISMGDTSVAVNNQVGILEFFVKDSQTPNVEMSSIRSISESTISEASSVNGALSFYNSAANVPTEMMRITSLGNVGINTTSPGYKFDVRGSARFTGTVKVATPIDDSDAVTKSYLDSALINSTSSNAYVRKAGDEMTGPLDMNENNITAVNKLSVVIIDPLYDISGTKYSTYASAIVGPVKEEYVGKGEIGQCAKDYCSWRLNFTKQKTGSDLWVWWKIIDFQPETVDVFMTAYGRPANLSYEIGDNQIIFYSDRPTKFSYRLVGARFDWRKWPTLAADQSEKASLIIK